MFFNKKKSKKKSALGKGNQISSTTERKSSLDSEEDFFSGKTHIQGNSLTLEKFDLNPPEKSTVKGFMMFTDTIGEHHISEIVKFLNQTKEEKDLFVSNTINGQTLEWGLGEKTSIIITTVNVIFGGNKLEQRSNVFESIQAFVNFLGTVGVKVNDIDIVQEFHKENGENLKTQFFIGTGGKLSFKAPLSFKQ